MRILCPTDFSPAAASGIVYVARFAKRVNAAVTLLNVQPLYITEGVNLFAGMELDSMHEAGVSENLLDDMCRELNKTFHIEVNHDVIPSFRSFEKIVNDESWKYNLIVIGTNGADSLYQLYFGTHSYRLAKMTRCPVLIIPEDFPYEVISTVVYASGYTKGDKLPLERLNLFMAEITTGTPLKLQALHVSEKDTPESQEVYMSFTRLAAESLGAGSEVKTDRIINEKGSEAVDSYMNQLKGAVLAVCLDENDFLYNLIHENLAKRLTAFANYPVLVFHK